MNTLDIIVIIIIGFSAIEGLIKGFIKTLFGLVAVIAAILLTIMFTPKVSDMVIENTSFDEMISEKTIELLDIEALVDSKFTDIEEQEIIQNLQLPNNLIEHLIENNTNMIKEQLNIDGFIEYIGMIIANMAVKALVFILLFVIITLILNAIVALLDLISQLPVLKQMNAVGGLFIGIILGSTIVWVATLILSFVISIQATGELSGLIESSVLTKIFYYNNPLQNFIMNIVKIS